MKLTLEEERKMTGLQQWKCPKCKHTVMKAYCGSCDEFYNVCDCEPEGRNDHRECP